jgi:hypothetical protein
VTGVAPPDEEFLRVADEVRRTDTDPAAVAIPPRFVSASALRKRRLTELRGDGRRLKNPLALHAATAVAEIPADLLESLLLGGRDYGRRRELDSNLGLWIKLAIRRDIDGAAVTQIQREQRELTLRHERDTHKYLQEIRSRLCDAGALPWAAWKNGKVPRGWLERPEFQEAVATWSQEGRIIRALFRSLDRSAA